MGSSQKSAKKVLIDKANYTIFAVTLITVFVTIFSLISSYYLLQQRAYQSRVIEKKQTTKKVLEANVKARDALVERYKEFVSQDPNAIGGVLDGSTERDGDNAKLTLDALPPVYDYPALITSMDKLIKSSGSSLASFNANDIGDDQVETEGVAEIPFDLSSQGSLEQSQQLLYDLERSIRPISVSKVAMVATENGLSLNILATTYYQTGKKLEIKDGIVE